MSDVAEKLPTKEEFSLHSEVVFHAEAGEGEGFDLSLLEVDEVISNEVQESFSLLFRAPGDAPPVQGIYRLEHAGLGKMDLFLVPVKKDESGLYYEAVFNNLVGL